MGHRFATLVVNHDKSHHVARQFLVDDGEVAHMQQLSLGLHVLVVGTDFHEIYTLGQCSYADGVFAFLVVGLSAITDRRVQHSRCLDGFQQLGIVGIVVGRPFRVAPYRKRRHLHVEAVDVSAFGFDHHRLVGVHLVVLDFRCHLRVGHVFDGIAQHIGTRPFAPSAQGPVGIIHQFFGAHVFALLHQFVACNGHFATFLQVFILVDERVECHGIVRFLERINIHLA